MLSDASREELLATMIAQLQADHAAAIAAGNVSAAVTASKAIADLLAVKLQPAPVDGDGHEVRISWMDPIAADFDSPFGPHEPGTSAADQINDDLAARLLRLLGDEPEPEGDSDAA